METGYKRNDIKDISYSSDIKTNKFDYYDDDIVFADNTYSFNGKSQTRTKAYTIMICWKGELDIELNGQFLHVAKDDLLIVPPATIVDAHKHSDDFECNIIMLTPRIVQAFLRSNMTVWNHAVYVNKVKTISLDERSRELCHKYCELLRVGIAFDKGFKLRREIMAAYLQAGLLALCSILGNMTESEFPTGKQHSENLFHRFLDLLDHSDEKRKPVEYYANKLCITPKYLSIICKKNSGKTAKEWIQEMVSENVRYYLKSTDKSIKEISDLLGFPNPSYLGRYVKERFGMSPKSYRDGLKQ